MVQMRNSRVKKTHKERINMLFKAGWIGITLRDARVFLDAALEKK